jgi:transcriptional regulator with XRE-family HTH domain
VTVQAARLLGARVRLARRERRWTVEELAERVGVTHVTMRKVERGDLTVGLGVAFEAAAVLGVPLFHEDPARRTLEAGRVDDRLAVLPALVRKPTEVHDDF